jgi:hypothetical protein
MVFEEIRAALQEDSTLNAVRNKAQEGLDGWSMADGLLLKDGKVFVPEISSWAQAVIAAAHEVGMKVSRKRYIEFRLIFVFHETVLAVHVNRTRQNSCVQRGCYRAWRFQLQFGQTLQWTLLRDCQG